MGGHYGYQLCGKRSHDPEVTLTKTGGRRRGCDFQQFWEPVPGSVLKTTDEELGGQLLEASQAPVRMFSKGTCLTPAPSSRWTTRGANCRPVPRKWSPVCKEHPEAVHTWLRQGPAQCIVVLGQNVSKKHLLKHSEGWYFSTWQISMIYKHRVLLAHSILVLPPTTFCQLGWGTKPKKSLCAYDCGQRNGLGRVFSHPDLRDQPSVSRSNERSSPEPQSEPPDSEASLGAGRTVSMWKSMGHSHLI